MNTRLNDKARRHLRVALAITLLALATPWAALADNVQNDVVAGGNDTITAGGSTTVNYRINANSGDGEPGCNATATSPATVTINAPAGVTASPASRIFTSCGTNQSVVFSSNTVGDYPITVTVSDSGTGTYNTNPANFTLHVLAPPDSTPPVITPNVVGTLGNNGWYVSDVAVSWSVVDNESAISSSTGCSATTINADTAGTTLTCSATSAGGTASQSVTIKRDATAPSLTGAATTSPNAAGWYNSNVTIDWTASDNLSGIDPATEPADSVLAGDGANQSASRTVSDLAGNSKTATVSGINIDKSAPTITDLGVVAGTAGTNGWYISAVTNKFGASDATSGFAGQTNPYDILVSSGTAEGSAVTVSSGTVTDVAGNTAASINSAVFKIDLSDPTNVQFVGGPAAGGSYYFGSVPAAPTCTASDAISGLAGCAVTGYSTAVGSHTVTAMATDNAGRTATAQRSYTVLAWTITGFYQPVDMSDYNNARGGSTVPLKFEVFAGSTELTDTSVVQTFAQRISCSAGIGDDIEQYATGGTSLRYDTTSGQFIFNWQTPRSPGACYRVTMTSQDGSSISADFKLR